MIKNIIFDVDGVLRTLIDSPISEVLSEPLMKKYGDRYKDLSVKQLYKKYLKHDYMPYINFDKGNITDTEIIDNICNDYNEPYETLSKIFAYHDIPKNQQYFKPTLNLAKKLKKTGYNLFILSNMGLAVSKLLKEYFEPNLFNDIIFSCDVHMMKPDKEIYEYAISRFKINPQESIFIDDRKENLEPFKSLGGNTFLFNDKDVENSVIELEKYILNN